MTHPSEVMEVPLALLVVFMKPHWNYTYNFNLNKAFVFGGAVFYH